MPVHQKLSALTEVAEKLDQVEIVRIKKDKSYLKYDQPIAVLIEITEKFVTLEDYLIRSSDKLPSKRESLKFAKNLYLSLKEFR